MIEIQFLRGIPDEMPDRFLHNLAVLLFRSQSGQRTIVFQHIKNEFFSFLLGSYFLDQYIKMSADRMKMDWVRFDLKAQIQQRVLKETS